MNRTITKDWETVLAETLHMINQRAAILTPIARALGGSVVLLTHDEILINLPEHQAQRMEKITKLVLEGADPYRAMAAGVFDVSIDDVTNVQRAAMKEQLFGFVYGVDIV